MQTYAPPPPERQIFCNRTLNLRAIEAIGYDMDYTLIHYDVDEWVQDDPNEGIRVGILVRHSHFGVGRVKQFSGSGPNARVTVDFLNHGMKRLVLMYARLTPLEEMPW